MNRSRGLGRGTWLSISAQECWLFLLAIGVILVPPTAVWRIEVTDTMHLVQSMATITVIIESSGWIEMQKRFFNFPRDCTKKTIHNSALRTP
jgi:hypothetical protein